MFPIHTADPLDFPITTANPEHPDTLAIDWETFYTSEYSLKHMSPIVYTGDEQFDPYLVAIYGNVGGVDVRYCGRPDKFPWEELKGRSISYLAHNAAFDEIVTWRYLVERQGWDLNLVTASMVFECTADMAAYLKYPRALAGLAYNLKLPTPDKTVRDRMKGVDFSKDEELTPERLAYAMNDARCCYLAWQRLSSLWPEHERKFALRSRRRCYRGVPISKELLVSGIAELEEKKVEAELDIPWPWRERGNKTPLSPLAMKAQCEADNIPVPASFAEDNAREWEEEFCQKLPWVAACRQWRKANTHGTRLARMLSNRSEETGYMHFQQLYCGAHTGRSSGTGGMNMQNIPWDKVADSDVNIRHMIEAPPGYVMMIADYNQIEPRLLYLQSGMDCVLDFIRDGMHPYEAHARATMGYTNKEKLKTHDPKLYKMAKFRVIGLGYGCGWKKFQWLCGRGADPLLMTDTEAQAAVESYRASHEAIVNYWYDHDQWLNISARQRDQTYSFTMLSGRTFEVFDPQYVNDPETEKLDLKARKSRGDNLVKMWGGTMTENEIQGTGMDIMKYAVANMGEDLLKYWLLDSHDELVFLLPKKNHKELGDEILRRMCDVPWLPKDFPLAADADYEERYMKT
jgi:hypothetical protein